MPIKRRITKLRRASLTKYEAIELLGAGTYFGFDQIHCARGPVFAEESRRAAWEGHGDDLLRYWVFGDATACLTRAGARGNPTGLDWHAYLVGVQDGGPGTRPWAWWRYSAPTHGVSGVDDDGNLIPAPWRDKPPGPERGNIRRGFPHVPDVEGSALSDALRYTDPLPLFESEAAYLKRHGLLLPGELELLTTADFEPRPFAEWGDEPDPRLDTDNEPWRA